MQSVGTSYVLVGMLSARSLAERGIELISNHEVSPTQLRVVSRPGRLSSLARAGLGRGLAERRGRLFVVDLGVLRLDLRLVLGAQRDQFLRVSRLGAAASGHSQGPDEEQGRNQECSHRMFSSQLNR